MSIERKKEKVKLRAKEALSCSDTAAAINQELKPLSDHKSVACVDLNNIFKYDCKLVYLGGILMQSLRVLSKVQYLIVVWCPLLTYHLYTNGFVAIVIYVIEKYLIIIF